MNMKDSIIYALIWLLDNLAPNDHTLWHIWHESHDDKLAGNLPYQTRQEVLEFLLMERKSPGKLRWEISSHLPRWYEDHEED